MALTYEQAAELAHRAGAVAWDPQWGTFCFDDREITEDDEVFVFYGAPREYIVDRDWAFATAGGGHVVVHKDNGELEWLPWVYLMTTRPGLRTKPNTRPVYFR